ncbi:MAG TPA: hypothetical protein VGI81_18325 [Tepidisphaeraceae bacterium]|jgi:hypothetical protein
MNALAAGGTGIAGVGAPQTAAAVASIQIGTTQPLQISIMKPRVTKGLRPDELNRDRKPAREMNTG